MRWKSLGQYWIALVLVCLSPAVSSADGSRRVLLIHSFGAHFSPFNSFSGQFRVELVTGSPKPLDISEVSLETARFTEFGRDDPFVDYLTALLSERRPDLVVTIGGAAAQFAQLHRAQLFPTTPLLLTAAEERVLRVGLATDKDAIAAFQLNPKAVVENILRLRPQTKRLFVVIGHSPLEQFWRQEAANALEAFGGRLTIEWSSSMSFDEILGKVSTLPPDAAVLYGLMVVDAEGVPYEEDRAISELYKKSVAPLFGLFASQLGKGIVGGPLLSTDELAKEAAGVALRILDGERPDALRLPARAAGTPEYDQRELDRWGISPKQLQADAKVLFREPSILQKYWWQIVAISLLCLVEAGLIAVLLEHRRRLARAKSALHLSQERLSTTAAAAGIGLWVWDIVRDELWLSECGRKLFGWSSSEDIDFERLIEASHEDARAAIRDKVQAALAGEGDFELEYRLVTDGEAHWVSSRGQVELGPDGKPVRMRGVTIDVTGRHRAEDAARDLAGRLIHVHEDERSRLARELHDDVTQRLAVLAIDAGRVERHAKATPDGAAMHDIREGLVRLSEDVHSLSYRLHPSILEDLGLADALQAECDRFAKLERIPVDLETSGIPEQLPPAVALCLFRVTQEALRNIGRHAEASQVHVSIRRMGDKLKVSVKDDGKGFDPGRQQVAPSLGFASMRQRVGLLGGKLRVESSPDQGTTIFAWVLLQKVDENESSARIAG